MKQKLTLFLIALVTSMGVWADVTVSHNPTTNGTFSNPSDNLYGYYTTWTSNSTSGIAGLTIETGGNLAMHQENIGNYGGNLLALKTTTSDGSTQETVTITAPSGYLIKGYTLKAQLQSSSKDKYRVYKTTGAYYSLDSYDHLTQNISETLTTPSNSITLKVVDLLVNSDLSTNALCFTELSVDLILPVTVNDTNGSFTRSSGTGDWNDTWTANSTIAAASGMTITTYTIPNNSNRFDMYYKNDVFKIATGYDGFTTQYTITAPSGYIIDSYEMNGSIPSAAGAGVSCRPNESTTWTYIGNSSTKVSVTDVGSSNAVFTLCGKNTEITLSSFVITLVPIHSKEATSALTNQIARATTISSSLGSLPGKYSITGDLATQKTSAQAVLDNGSSTATEKATASTALYNVIKTMTPNYPVSGFYRIYAPNQNVYVKSATNAAVFINTTAATDNSTSIFYLENTDANKHEYKMLSYANGQYFVGQQQGAIGDYGTYRLMLGTAQECFAVYGQAVNRQSGTSYSNATTKLWYIHQTTTLGYSSNYPSNANYNVKFEPLTSLPISMHQVPESTGSYYATINLPVAVEIPSDLKAYSAVANNNTQILTLTKVVENGVLKANSPVILYSETGVTSLDISNETGYSPDGSNELEGTIAAENVEANENYILSKNGDDVGFYLYNNTVMPGFKAYLPADATTDVKAFTFCFEDVEDAIRAIECENSGLEIYDVAGRKVQKAQKGLYIVNGKKVMYK